MFNVKINLSKFAVTALLCSALTACSNKPSISDVDNQMQSTLASRCPGVSAFDFKKINGEDVSDSVHTLAVSYKVKIIDAKNLCKDRNDGFVIYYIGTAHQDGVDFKNGSIFEVKEIETMTKTDNGWVLSNIPILT